MMCLACEKNKKNRVKILGLYIIIYYYILFIIILLLSYNKQTIYT